MTIFSQELADRICAELAEGQSLRTICKAEGMPTKTAVFNWLRVNETFREQYAIAKQESADAFVEEMLDIADDLTDEAQSRRVRVDTRKWIASKLKPKKYGDKLELAGKVDSTVNAVVTFVEPTKKDEPDER